MTSTTTAPVSVLPAAQAASASPLLSLFAAAPELAPQAQTVFSAFAGFIGMLEAFFPNASGIQKLGHATTLVTGLIPQLAKVTQDVSATISVMAPVIKAPGGIVGELLTGAAEAPAITTGVAGVISDVQGIVGTVTGKAVPVVPEPQPSMPVADPVPQGG